MSLLIKIQKETALAAAARDALTEGDARRFIFVSVDAHDGDFASGYANGIAGADDFCATQKATHFSALPGSNGDYAALMMDDGTNRRACTTANCGGGTAEHVDWVLAPNTTYYNPDGASLLQTNAAGVFDFGSFSLDLAIDTNGSVEWWTGRLANDWIVSGNFNCSDWTVNIAGAPLTNNAYYGIGADTTENSLSYLNDSCDQTRRVLCVRR